MTKLELIDASKKLSYWELGNILEQCAKALKDMPMAVIKDVEYEEQEAYLRIEAIITGVNNRLVTLEQALATSEENLTKVTEEHYNKTSKVVYALNKKLAELPEINPGYRLPYNAKEIFELAERYADLPDNVWQKMIELAHAFASKQENV